MRFRLSLVALAVMALAASPAWAGQVNLSTVTRVTTVTETVAQTDTGSFADTALKTTANTFLDTKLNTLANTALKTSTGSLGNTALTTQVDTMLKTIIHTGAGGGSTKTIVNTALDTVAATNTGTWASTAVQTLLETSVDTIANTALRTAISTAAGTNANTLLSTIVTTVSETIIYAGQAADVSIEISQAGLNMTSPFGNSLEASGLENNVGVAGTTGVTQVQSNVGNANVTVATNSILDGGQLVALAGEMSSEAGLKELGVLTLVPGLALQNSTAATTAHIAGLALAAAEGGAVVTAVDIVQADINEYSPHSNVTDIMGLVRNNVAVRGTSGITQVQANAGSANVGGTHNVLLVNTGSGPF